MNDVYRNPDKKIIVLVNIIWFCGNRYYVVPLHLIALLEFSYYNSYVWWYNIVLFSFVLSKRIKRQKKKNKVKEKARESERDIQLVRENYFIQNCPF